MTDSPVTVTTLDDGQTRALGAGVARLLTGGDVVLLVGSLGTGKTTFVKGLVAALGGPDPVTSPTFTLARRYRTAPPVTHVDLWRLDHLQEVLDLALEEELDDGGVVVIEWGEAAESLGGADALVLHFGWGSTDGERTISTETRGESWASRAQRLREAFDAAVDPGRAVGT